MDNIKKLFCVVLFVQLLGCSAVLSTLPTVITAVLDAVIILDNIEEYVDRYFIMNPNPEKQAKINEVLSIARTSLNVAIRVTQGAENLSKEEIAEAFQAFKEAYQQLLVLIKPLGIKEATNLNDTLSLSPEQLVIPKPLALKY